MAALTTKTTSALDEFAVRAAESSMRGAVEFLAPVGTPRPTWSHDEVESLLVLIREETKKALPAALKDAREAMESGMGGFATATFTASMRLAGIAAAKRWKGAVS